MMSTLEASERLAAAITVALTVSEADCEAVLAIMRQEETMMPIMDPTRYRVEGDGIRMSRRVAESFLAFRKLLAETPAGQAAALAAAPVIYSDGDQVQTRPGSDDN